MYTKYAYVIITYLTCTMLSYDVTYSMETTNNDLVVYSIPGQNGLGGDPEYIKCLFNSQDIPIVQVSTPTFLADLGQSFCQKHLTQAIAKENRDIIIHATSQRRDTVLNYLSKHQNEKTKAIILELPFASGNQAIYHTATHELMPFFNFIENIPGAYYIAPYVGALMSPGYLPIGQQPIFSIQKRSFPKNIPIVIVHSKNDPQLSFLGACALYYGLKSRCSNIYFIPLAGCNHLQLLSSNHNKNQKIALQKIINKHMPTLKLDIENNRDNDLSEYTPEVKNYKTNHGNLIKQETILWYSSVAGLIALSSLLLIILKR